MGEIFLHNLLNKTSLLSLWREEGGFLRGEQCWIYNLWCFNTDNALYFKPLFLTSQQIKRQIESTMQQKQHGVLFVIIAEL